MSSQRTCQVCSSNKASLGFLSHLPTPCICFPSWSFLNLWTLNPWQDHEIRCLWKRLSLALFSLVSFVTPSPWALFWPNDLGQGSFGLYTADHEAMHSALTAPQGLAEAGNESRTRRQWGSWPLGTCMTSLSSTALCLATTYVKGLNKSLKFPSCNLLGFTIGLWHVLGQRLFLPDSSPMSFSLNFISHLLTTFLSTVVDVTNWLLVPLSHRAIQALEVFLTPSRRQVLLDYIGSWTGLLPFCFLYKRIKNLPHTYQTHSLSFYKRENILIPPKQQRHNLRIKKNPVNGKILAV